MADDVLQFSVDSSLLFQLGEQLVSKPSIALAELVKNAYDADASHVNIIMENIEQPGGTILIADNGHGMTFEEIRDSWMRIATTNKQRNPRSRYYKRSVAGAKGIGRFAARRLGSLLTLESTAKRIDDDTLETVQVRFNWDEFQLGLNIENIKVEYKRHVIASSNNTGVSLLIENTRDAWDVSSIVGLKRDLLSIQTPFPDLVKQATQSFDQETGFTIGIDIGQSQGLEKLSGDLGEQLIGLHWAKLEGWVETNGLAHYHIDINKINKEQHLEDDIETYIGLEGAYFRIYFFVTTEPSIFADSDISLKEFRRKAKSDSGVRLYLDNFRVFPYGEDGDDWLRNDFYASQNVDIAKDVPVSGRMAELVNDITSKHSDRPYLLFPRSRQLFGAVFLTQMDHPHIKITTDREGIIENEEFHKLRRFVQRGIYWLTLQYAAETAEKRRGVNSRRTQQKRPVYQIIDEATDEIRKLPTLALSDLIQELGTEDLQNTIEDTTVSNSNTSVGYSSISTIGKNDPPRISNIRSNLAHKIGSIAQKLEEASEQSKAEEEETITELAMLRLLASAGTSLLLMQHQIRALLDQVKFIRVLLIELQGEVPQSIRNKYDTIAQAVADWNNLVEAQISQLSSILTPDNRQRRRQHVLSQIVESVTNSMGYYMKANHISLVHEIPMDLRTPSMYKAELYSVLLNILTNALKAVYSQEIRRICIESEKTNGNLYIRMYNTGKRVPISMREEYFKPFVSDSIPNPVLGIGSGLGLKVVRDTLEFYDGHAKFIDVQEPWQTGIELRIPYT